MNYIQVHQHKAITHYEKTLICIRTKCKRPPANYKDS